MKNKIIDFERARQEKIDEKRRKYERVIFKNIMGVYSVIEGQGLSAIELVDFSFEGCAFQLPKSNNSPNYNKGETFTMRLYFSEKSFIPVKITIKNKYESIEGGYPFVRYGCEIDQTQSSYKAIKQFISFVYSYAEEAVEENGGEKILFYL